MQSVTIGANQAGQRFDKFLHKYLPNAGTSFLYKMLRKKNITLNGKKAEGKEILVSGDEITFFFSEETFAKFSGSSETNEYMAAYEKLQGISVLYEDEHVIILNKPVGILSQKAVAQDVSLNEWLIGYLLENKRITTVELQSFHPSVCNRLDRNTSGIVLCGKTLAGSQALSRVIKARTIRKFYRTICVGEIKKDETINGYLYKDNKTNTVTVCDRIPDRANRQDYSAIQTAYHPIVRNNGLTLLEVELITGKTHQIRSHLSHISHPIIGDSKYGNKKYNRHFRESDGLENQLLHAYRVVFPGEEGVLSALSCREIIAPYPKLFQQLEQKLFMSHK